MIAWTILPNYNFSESDLVSIILYLKFRSIQMYEMLWMFLWKCSYIYDFMEKYAVWLGKE